MASEATLIDTVSELQDAICRHAIYSMGKRWQDLSRYDRFEAVALTVRDHMMERFLQTEATYRRQDVKRLYYLSIEFLIGRSLGANLRNLGMYAACREALKNLGADLQEIEEMEPDAALGNGGLGRLGACFIDSLATLGMPGYGYGINYEFGLFRQEIVNGYQRELPDNWLSLGSPWQMPRPDEACLIPIYGNVEHGTDRFGGYNPMWMNWKVILGLPNDVLIPGYGGRTVNFLRLYSARASHEFDMQIFNDGDYFNAVNQKIQTETISKVLYPSDSVIAGQELRLAQEYFLAACAVRDIVRRFENEHHDWKQFSAKVAIQLNDTHPVLAIAELMRLLVDEKQVAWDEAWKIVQETFGYTNHTLSAEALESWPVELIRRLLPRHLQILEEVDRRFLQVVLELPSAERMTILSSGTPQQARMVNLALQGSHSVNGVSPIHTSLLRSQLLPEFYRLWPEKFNNKTNGISPRRWLLHANPELARLVTASVGEGWVTNLNELLALERFAEDPGFQLEFQDVKEANKARLTQLVREQVQVTLDPESMFDVHVKRIHAYKRQLLKVLHIIHQYLELVEDGTAPTVARSYIFAGKAAPGYWHAKQIIKLIHSVAEVINRDSRTRDLIKVAFIPDYRITLAERIIPAADLSEQISTAGKEASGTGNMKLALNGAILMGSRDGTNLDIAIQVGEENTFLFGCTAEQVQAMRQTQSYRPQELCNQDGRLSRVLTALQSGLFCHQEPEFCAWIDRTLLSEQDEQVHFADLPAYLAAQQAAEEAFVNRRRWLRMSILNVARVGMFSSDRAISEYATEIWHLNRVG